jgi:hypothetical protein
MGHLAGDGSCAPGTVAYTCLPGQTASNPGRIGAHFPPSNPKTRRSARRRQRHYAVVGSVSLIPSSAELAQLEDCLQILLSPLAFGEVGAAQLAYQQYFHARDFVLTRRRPEFGRSHGPAP